MNKVHNRINMVVNLAIILVVALIGVAIARRYVPSFRSQNKNHDYRVAPGKNVALPGVDWQKNGETLLLVLDTKCAFCTASAPFYQEITRDAARNRSVRVVAVLPESVAESKQYLSDLNVPIDEVRQASFEALGVQGTPTLILVNRNGQVDQSWPGKLLPDQETEVLKRIGR